MQNYGGEILQVRVLRQGYLCETEGNFAALPKPLSCYGPHPSRDYASYWSGVTGSAISADIICLTVV